MAGTFAPGGRFHHCGLRDLNAEPTAQIAGSAWLAADIIVLVMLRMRGQRAPLPAEDL